MVIVSGLIGNFLVVLIIWKNKDILGSSFGVYLFESALTGFSVSIFCLPAYITLTPIFREHRTGIAGEGKCKTLSAYVIVNYFEDLSMFTFTVIPLERYVAVCKPLSTYARSTTKRVKLTLCAECLICTLPVIPNIIGLKYANSTTSPTTGAHCVHELDKYGVGTVWRSLFQVIEIVLFWFSEILILFCFIKIKININPASKLCQNEWQYSAWSLTTCQTTRKNADNNYSSHSFLFCFLNTISSHFPNSSF